MVQPDFDIFSGTPENGAVWVEVVAGLSNARERMKQLATLKPGPYFIFSVQSQSVIARIQTFEKRG